MTIDNKQWVTIGRTATGAAIVTDKGLMRGVTINVTGFSGNVMIVVMTGKGTMTKVETTGVDSIVLLQ